MRIVLALLFLLTSVLSAGATTTISSLPYTANSAGETYLLTSDLTMASAGSAVTIDADGVIINCQGHTINFSQVAPTADSDNVGINVDNHSNTEIKNCKFSTSYTGQIVTVDGDVPFVRHIYLGATGASGTWIHDVTINLVGRAQGNGLLDEYDRDHGIEGDGGTGTIIESTTFAQSGLDRAISIHTLSGTWIIRNNTFTCTSCTRTNSDTYPFFIRTMNDSVVTISDNTFTVDSNSTAVYPISGWDNNGASVLRNTITHSGSVGRAINPDNASSGWLIQDNRITFNGAGNDTLYGIRYRNANSSGGNCGGQHTIEYNTVDCSGYTGTGMCYAMAIGGYPDATDPCYQTHVRYNYLKAKLNTFVFYTSEPAGNLNLTDNDIYCNKIEATTGAPVYIPNADNEISDIVLSYNWLISGNSYEVNNSGGVTWHSADIVFCGTYPELDVTGGGTIPTTGTCQNGSAGCYNLAGVRNRASFGGTYYGATIYR